MVLNMRDREFSTEIFHLKTSRRRENSQKAHFDTSLMFILDSQENNVKYCDENRL